MGSLSSPNLIKDVYTSLVFRKSDGIFYRDDGTDDIALFNPAILDEDNMASNSATRIASQQSIKAYVDAQVTASDLDFQADSGGALSIDLDSETLTLTGGGGSISAPPGTPPPPPPVKPKSTVAYANQKGKQGGVSNSLNPSESLPQFDAGAMVSQSKIRTLGISV